MRRNIWLVGFCFGIYANFGLAQATVTTDGGITNAIPKFSGNATLSGSAITEVNGNVGIGTANPNSRLEVNGSTQIDNGGSFGAGSASSCASGGASCISLNAVGDSSNAGYAQIQTYFAGVGYTAPMALNPSGGNVGIGTTQPWKMLAIGNGFGATFGLGGVIGTSYNFDFSTTLGNYLQIMSEQPGAVPFAITGSGDVGIGTTAPGAKLDVAGSVKLSGSGASITFPDNSTQSTAWNGILGGGDYAESVEVSGDRVHYEPGDVLAVSEADSADVAKPSQPYSTLVLGVYSTKPGVLGRRRSGEKHEREIPMAMVGIVPIKVSAENGPIKKGDLLVTASIPGYAMKGTESSKMVGALIGKALGSIESGTGVIEAAIILQ